MAADKLKVAESALCDFNALIFFILGTKNIFSRVFVVYFQLKNYSKLVRNKKIIKIPVNNCFKQMTMKRKLRQSEEEEEPAAIEANPKKLRNDGE